MLASGSGRDAWMDSGDDIEATGDDFKNDRPVDECDQVVRSAFVRRVYRQVEVGYLNNSDYHRLNRCEFFPSVFYSLS